MAYVTLAAAKEHLQIVDDRSNADVLAKVEMASDTIAGYLKSRADATWTETTAPGEVQIATLWLLTHFYERRGVDMSGDAALWDAIGRVLCRLRDPALA